MAEIRKHPIVIQDLIEQATFIAADNLEAAEQFLVAAEATFQQLGQLPGIGRLSIFSNPLLQGIRQYPIKGFKNHLVFYRDQGSDVEILRVLHGARDLEATLEGDLD